MEAHIRPSPLAPRLENLTAVTASDVLLAYLAASKARLCSLPKVRGALAAYLHDPAFDEAFDALDSRGLLDTASRRRCALNEEGKAAAAARFGGWPERGWSALAGAALPALALGLDLHDEKTAEYLSRKENMESLVLGRVYGFAAAGTMPARARTRSLLLRLLLAARFPECAANLEGARLDGFKPDPLSKALIMGLAGMTRGSIREAESALALQALGVAPGERAGLAQAIVRAALQASRGGAAAMRPAAANEAAAANGSSPLSAFADAVRRLARTMESRSYSGRVAIAEVYDAGLDYGESFGSLENFKTRVAEACRAGLIDLERYDIAGSLDPALRDRSRTPFGRDERHFIVTECV